MGVTYRARCSTRAQHRKTIEGNYDPNDRVPCHVKSCKGMMRKDVTRERDCTKDASGGHGLCRCDGFAMGQKNSPHRKGSRGCKFYEAIIAKRNRSPRSKHSPIPADEWVPF